MARATRLIVILALAALLWPAAGPARARLITDMAGRQVDVPAVVRKVYASAPPATYMVLALSPELLVGLNAPPPESARGYLSPRLWELPVLGGWFGQGRGANLESLLAARPDVVLAFGWRDQPAQWKIAQTLAPLGLPVIRVELGGLADFPRFFLFLGQLCNQPERGRALAAHARGVLDDMARLRAAVPPPKRPRVYYAEGPRGLHTECDQSFHAELIELCGGQNVRKCRAGGIHGMERVSMEQVLAYDPQVILSHDPLFLGQELKQGLWRGLPAVREGRAYAIPTRPLNWFDRPPSFMRLLGAQWLAHKLHPQLYPVDMAAKTVEFFRLFLGVELSRQAAEELLGP